MSVYRAIIKKLLLYRNMLGVTVGVGPYIYSYLQEFETGGEILEALRKAEAREELKQQQQQSAGSSSSRHHRPPPPDQTTPARAAPPPPTKRKLSTGESMATASGVISGALHKRLKVSEEEHGELHTGCDGRRGGLAGGQAERWRRHGGCCFVVAPASWGQWWWWLCWCGADQYTDHVDWWSGWWWAGG